MTYKTNLVDRPILDNKSDNLGITKYVGALAKFIDNAETPITLSIQGEWGSGKTSFMNQLKAELCDKSDKDDKKPRFRSIWINIWQMSLLNNPEMTLVSVIKEISNVLRDVLVDEYHEKLDDSSLWSILLNACKRIGGKLTKGALAFAFDSIVPGSGGLIISLKNDKGETQKQTITISELQSAMKSVIERCYKKDVENGKKGFIFFIDDLDRLDPQVAVSVLELLKNVFEIEHCIFILAIDYDVVVRGLANKFGELSDANERQFRSFFDKIIQLPFNIPIQSYNTQNYVANALCNIGYFKQEDLDKVTCVTGEDFEINQEIEDNTTDTESGKISVLECAVEMIKLSTGSNPRSMIRLVNSLSLNQIMWDSDNERNEDLSLSNEDRLINLGLTCIQISYGSIYSLLNSNPCFVKWDDGFAEQSRLSKLTEQDLKEAQLANETMPWQLVLRRATKNNVYMRQRRKNIEKILELIAKLTIGKDLTAIGSNEDLLTDLEKKLTDLLSFSAVTNSGISVVEEKPRRIRKGTDIGLDGLIDFLNRKNRMPEYLLNFFRNSIEDAIKACDNNIVLRFRKAANQFSLVKKDGGCQTILYGNFSKSSLYFKKEVQGGESIRLLSITYNKFEKDTPNNEVELRKIHDEFVEELKDSYSRFAD